MKTGVFNREFTQSWSFEETVAKAKFVPYSGITRTGTGANVTESTVCLALHQANVPSNALVRLPGGNSLSLVKRVVCTYDKLTISQRQPQTRLLYFDVSLQKWRVKCIVLLMLILC